MVAFSEHFNRWRQNLGRHESNSDALHSSVTAGQLTAISIELEGATPYLGSITALENALIALNAPTTPFFTVGCEKAFGKNESGHWIGGYLEFAFNYAELVEDAAFYFKLFFLFNQWYWNQKQQAGVKYTFELAGATCS